VAPLVPHLKAVLGQIHQFAGDAGPLGQLAQNLDHRPKTTCPPVSIQILESPSHLPGTASHNLHPVCGPLKKRPEGVQLGETPKRVPRRKIPLHGRPRRRTARVPVMWQPRPEQHQILRLKAANVIPDEPRSTPLRKEGQFHRGMKMPSIPFPFNFSGFPGIQHQGRIADSPPPPQEPEGMARRRSGEFSIQAHGSNFHKIPVVDQKFDTIVLKNGTACVASPPLFATLLPPMDSAPVSYRFSFGPWNISEGSDPFGPEVRQAFPHERKYALYKSLGFDAVQLHDDDAVPNLDNQSPEQLERKAAALRTTLENEGLVPEFVAPRLWFSEHTVDGAYTSNSASDREYAWDRTKKAIDIARILGCKGIVLWLSREGTYIREAKNARTAYERLLGTINAMLAYDANIEVWIEPKPNEPTDQAYVPTIGHAIALAHASNDPKRVKGLIETAHAILAGLDPSDEMAFALAHDKLASVHLNDQNGLKYDQDKNFGSANLRAAFNQVRVLEEAGYGRRGEFIGLDVKAMRTQKGYPVTDHLAHSRTVFLHLVEKVRSVDQTLITQMQEARDYEALELYILRHLMGAR
jgi:xylose isomerase